MVGAGTAAVAGATGEAAVVAKPGLGLLAGGEKTASLWAKSFALHASSP